MFIADCQLPIANGRIANCRLPIANLTKSDKSAIGNRQSAML